MERDEFAAKVRTAVGHLPPERQQDLLLSLAGAFLPRLNPAQLAAVRQEIAEQHATRGRGAVELLELIDGHLALRDLQA